MLWAPTHWEELDQWGRFEWALDDENHQHYCYFEECQTKVVRNTWWSSRNCAIETLPCPSLTLSIISSFLYFRVVTNRLFRSVLGHHRELNHEKKTQVSLGFTSLELLNQHDECICVLRKRIICGKHKQIPKEFLEFFWRRPWDDRGWKDDAIYYKGHRNINSFLLLFNFKEKKINVTVKLSFKTVVGQL